MNLINEFYGNTAAWGFLALIIFGFIWIHLEDLYGSSELENLTGVKKLIYTSLIFFGFPFGLYIVGAGLWELYWWFDTIESYQEMQNYYKENSIEGPSPIFSFFWTYTGPFILFFIGFSMIHKMKTYREQLNKVKK